MVELANSFKMGTVKYVGITDFAQGDWIGVALEGPYGKLCPVLGELVVIFLFTFSCR